MTQAVKTTTPTASRARLSNGLAIASGKGGVGKTWLAITLCQAWARLDQNVLLFDGDLGLANVDVQLGLAPAKDLGGVFAGDYPLAEAAVPVADGGFTVIAGRSGSGGLATLAPERLALIGVGLAGLAPRFDRLVIDLGAGVERTVRQLAAQAARCLVVTTDEPTAMTDAYAFIKLSMQQKVRPDLRVVVNMAETQTEGERTYATLRKACESFLKVSPPLAGIVRRDRKVKEAIQHQSPLLVRHPNSDAAQDVAALARKLMDVP